VVGFFFAGVIWHNVQVHAALRIGLLAMLVAACAEPVDEPPTPPAPVPIEPPPPLTVAAMYSSTQLPEFHLTLDEAAMAALADEPKVYVKGTFRYEEAVFENIGIRLKGSFTLTTLAEKPSFKVKFNAFTKGGRFLGLEGLTLNNLHHDTSMLKEWLGYAVFRAMGVPAPRTGYATVTVNGEHYGLYLNLQPYNDDFLEENFDDPLGSLYEAESGDDINKSVDGFDLDEGDPDLEALELFAEQAKEDSDRIFYGADSVLDGSEFLSYTAAEALIGHFDGYQSPHNYYMYYETAAGTWSYLPWSLDQVFVRRTTPFDGNGYLLRKCIDDVAECRLDYIFRARAAADTFEALDLSSEVDSVLALIDEAARADTRKRYTNTSMENAQEGLRKWLGNRLEGFRADLDCLVDGVEPDDDSDGFGPCAHDCNDADPAIHPDAEEVCDGIDNNCSGYIDDNPDCPCPSQTVDEVDYFFCTHVRKWTQARAFCKAQGHQLARIDSAEQNEAVWAVAHETKGGIWAIGLNDRKTEDEYLWGDGTEATFTNWAEGEPAKLLPQFDCTFYKGSAAPLWYERNCSSKAPFICSALPDP